MAASDRNVLELHPSGGSDSSTLEQQTMLSALPAPAHQSQASVTSQQQQQQLPDTLPALLSSVLSTDRAAASRRPNQQTMQAQQAQASQDAQEALEGHGSFTNVGPQNRCALCSSAL